MIEHPVAQIRLGPNTGAHETDTPQKPACNDQQNNAKHGHTDPADQKLQVKCLHNTVYLHKAGVDAVDHQLIQLRNFQLQIVHDHQGDQAKQQQRQKPQIIPVDMLAENHRFSPFTTICFEYRNAFTFLSAELFSVEDRLHQLVAVIAQLQQEKGGILPQQVQEDLISLPLGQAVQEVPVNPLQVPLVAFL